MKPYTFTIGDKKCVALVRKLTEKETLRLMGVRDKYISTMQASGVSKSQLYKQAGNSIVVDVLFHMFRKMFCEPENESAQMSIFDAMDQQPRERYTHTNPLRVITLCSGYDSQCLALEMLKEYDPEFDYDLVAWCEIDKDAIRSHNALFPQWADRNLGDMTKVDWTKVPGCDLLFYSTPCQSISQAGLQHGFTEGSGTRSSIIWYTREAIKALRPKYTCLENVPAMVSEKFLPMFNLWRDAVQDFGYVNFAKVLNAKDYGIPQNRDRIFLWSLRDDGDDPYYNWPIPFRLPVTLESMLEDIVDTKYYLNPNKVNKFVQDNLIMIESFAKERADEIEKIPAGLKQWLLDYPEGQEVQ